MSLKDITSVIASGFSMLKSYEIEKRLEQCSNCDFSIKKKKNIKCSKCGCDMRIKAQFSGTKCPVDENW